MAITIRKIQLWRREVANQPGALASTLEPLAKSGANLRVVMGYRFPGNESQAAIEVFPVTGARSAAAARQGGLTPANIPVLLIEGDNRAGLGYSFASSLAEERINIAFLVAHVIGTRYVAVVGFDNESDADRAAPILRRVAATRPRTAPARRLKASKTKRAKKR